MEKAHILEERKRIRATAKEVQLAEQQLKKAQCEEAKIAQQVNQQLKNDLKQAKKGKKKAITPIIVNQVDIVDDQVSSINEEPILT